MIWKQPVTFRCFNTKHGNNLKSKHVIKFVHFDLFMQELKDKLKDIVENYKNLYSHYEEKKAVFLEEKKARETANGVIENATTGITFTIL